MHYRHERGATRRALVRCVMKTGLLSAEVTGQNPSEIPGAEQIGTSNVGHNNAKNRDVSAPCGARPRARKPRASLRQSPYFLVVL